MSTSRKLSEEQVIDIYIRYGRGESCDILAKEFNISKGMAYHIGAGNKWYSVTDLISRILEWVAISFSRGQGGRKGLC